MIYIIALLITFILIYKTILIVNTKRNKINSEIIIDKISHDERVIRISATLLIVVPVIISITISNISSREIIYLAQLMYFAWITWYEDTSDILIMNDGIVINYKYIEWNFISGFNNLRFNTIQIESDKAWSGNIISRSIVDIELLEKYINKYTRKE